MPADQQTTPAEVVARELAHPICRNPTNKDAREVKAARIIAALAAAGFRICQERGT